MAQVVMVKESELRTYEYHIQGNVVLSVFNHQDGERYPMPFRGGRERKVHVDKKGREYIKLDGYKHFIGE